jgi:hypothetical protein
MLPIELGLPLKPPFYEIGEGTNGSEYSDGVIEFETEPRATLNELTFCWLGVDGPRYNSRIWR